MQQCTLANNLKCASCVQLIVVHYSCSPLPSRGVGKAAVCPSSQQVGDALNHHSSKNMQFSLSFILWVTLWGAW